MTKQEIINEIAKNRKLLEMYEPYGKELGYNNYKAFHIPYTKGKIAQLEKELEKMDNLKAII